MGYAWYRGFVPVADGPDRARLRFALNLPLLPRGVSISAAGYESWTDYIFEAEVSLHPEQVASLMRGRTFRQQELIRPNDLTDAARIDGYTGFAIAEHWSWEDRSTALRPGDMGSACDIWWNAAHNRAFVRYTAD